MLAQCLPHLTTNQPHFDSSFAFTRHVGVLRHSVSQIISFNLHEQGMPLAIHTIPMF